MSHCSSDFLRCVAAAVLILNGIAFGELPVVPSPLVEAGQHASGTGIELAVDPVAVAVLRSQNPARLVDFPLDGQSVSIDVRRIEPFAPDARIVLNTKAGAVTLPTPDLLVVSGSIVGDDGSLVVIGFSPSGVNGLIRTDDRQFVISSGPSFDGSSAVIFELTAGSVAALKIRAGRCGTEDRMQRPVSGAPASGDAGSRSGPPCRLATIALETDNEFLDVFGDNVAAATAYAGTLISASSEIYIRDFGAGMQLGFLHLWEANDPWTETDAYQQLGQFQAYWNAFMTGVSRNAVQFLTPRPLESASGLAYLGGLCAFGNDYSLSSEINGFFPYPIVHNNSQNWDLLLVSHEFGHNFGAGHTYAMSPPVDGCGPDGTDCSVIPNATIMSMCHIYCDPPGVAGVRMEFHSRSVDEQILPFLAGLTACDLSASPVTITTQPVSVVACPGDPVSFSVTATGSGTLTYQWRRNGTDIPGATNSTYSIASYSPAAHNGNYKVLVTNVCGSVLSNVATLSRCVFEEGGG